MNHLRLKTLVICMALFCFSAVLLAQPNGERWWNGNDPFNQPAPTLHYYGSGDVNDDGVINGLDVGDLDDMVNGTREPNIMADVDGDGVVVGDTDSYTLLYDYVFNSLDHLPGHWNDLNETEKRYWLSRIFEDDPGNGNPAIDITHAYDVQTHWWNCGEFSAQVFTRSAYFRHDLFSTHYNGGQTIYNLPMYMAVKPGHGFNAILVGTNPLDIDDWVIIDTYQLGDGFDESLSMYEPWIDIQVPEYFVGCGGVNEGGTRSLIHFEYNGTTWSATDINSSFGVNAPLTVTAYQPDVWNPTLLDERHLFYESQREDMSRLNDIFLSDLVLDTADDIPLLDGTDMAVGYVRLLDVKKDNSGASHILFTARPEINGIYVPAVYYGELDLDTNEVLNMERISFIDETAPYYQPRPALGRIFITPDDEIFLFWAHSDDAISNTGVYWTKSTSTGWQTVEMISGTLGTGVTVLANPLGDEFTWSKPSHWKGCFDVTMGETVTGSEELVLVFTRSNLLNMGNSYLEEVRYNFGTNQWGSATQIASYNSSSHFLCNGNVCTDANGDIHLVYEKKFKTTYWGDLYHKIYDYTTGTWTGGTTRMFDSELPPNYQLLREPQIGSLNQGDMIYLVYEGKNTNYNESRACYNIYEDGSWLPLSANLVVSLSQGRDVWYPKALYLDNGTFMFTWSERTDDDVTIGMADNIGVSTHQVTTPIPQVEIFSPADGHRFSTQYLTLHAKVDDDVDIDRVEFYYDNTYIGLGYSYDGINYRKYWNTLNLMVGGTYKVKAIVYDDDDGDGQSDHYSTDIISVKKIMPPRSKGIVSVPQCELLQNYPNPFNPETNISFNLPQQEEVSLKIYNLEGQLVRTLVNEEKESGYHSVVWNGTDEAGKEVSSGVYVYRISSGDYQETKRMLLLK